MLLLGSGLLIKSYARLFTRDLNFEPHDLLTFEYRLPFERFLQVIGEFQGYPYLAVDPSAIVQLQRVFDRLRVLPDVDSIAGISNLPVNSFLAPRMRITLEGADSSQGDTSYFLVTPDLFAPLKTPFVRGRDFDQRDTPGRNGLL